MGEKMEDATRRKKWSKPCLEIQAAR